MEEAIAIIRLQLGPYYDIVIGGFDLMNEVVVSGARLTDTGHAKGLARRENSAYVAVQPITRSFPGGLLHLSKFLVVSDELDSVCSLCPNSERSYLVRNGVLLLYGMLVNLVVQGLALPRVFRARPRILFYSPRSTEWIFIHLEFLGLTAW